MAQLEIWCETALLKKKKKPQALVGVRLNQAQACVMLDTEP